MLGGNTPESSQDLSDSFPEDVVVQNSPTKKSPEKQASPSKEASTETTEEDFNSEDIGINVAKNDPPTPEKKPQSSSPSKDDLAFQKQKADLEAQKQISEFWKLRCTNAESFTVELRKKLLAVEDERDKLKIKLYFESAKVKNLGKKLLKKTSEEEAIANCESETTTNNTATAAKSKPDAAEKPAEKPTAEKPTAEENDNKAQTYTDNNTSPQKTTATKTFVVKSNRYNNPQTPDESTTENSPQKSYQSSPQKSAQGSPKRRSPRKTPRKSGSSRRGSGATANADGGANISTPSPKRRGRRRQKRKSST